MTVENFVRIVRIVFEKIEKSRKMAFSHSSHTILMPLRMQGPSGCRMTVQNFIKIVWTVFEKFKRRKKTKNDTSSRKFFPTPKNLSSMKFILFIKTSAYGVYYFPTPHFKKEEENHDL